MVQVMDMNGFERPTPALFVFVPMGWRSQGGVQWGQQFMCNNGLQLQLGGKLARWVADGGHPAAGPLGVEQLRRAREFTRLPRAVDQQSAAIPAAGW